MQIIYIAVVTPGGTVAADLRAVSYIGIPLAYATAKSQAWSWRSGSTGTCRIHWCTGRYGRHGTVLWNCHDESCLAAHIGWARLDKKDFGIITKVNVIFAADFAYSCILIPVMLITYYGVTGAVTDFKTALPMDSWYMKSLFTIGGLRVCGGIAILLKSVVSKATDLIFFLFGFTVAASMHSNSDCGNCSRCCIRTDQYQMTMIRLRGAKTNTNEEEDIWYEEAFEKVLSKSFWRWFTEI